MCSPVDIFCYSKSFNNFYEETLYDSNKNRHLLYGLNFNLITKNNNSNSSFYYRNNYFKKDKLKFINEFKFKNLNKDNILLDKLNKGLISDIISRSRSIESPIYIELPSFERLIAHSAKLKKLDELLERLKREHHRVLIFCQMTKMIDILEEYMTKRRYSYFRMDGSTNIADRRDMVNEFQSNENIFAFLLSTRAGGLGVNLTAADTVIFYDNDWNPTMDAQATDRVHRIGQTKPVSVYRLTTKNSVEERILLRAKQKQNVQTTVYSGGAFKADVFKQAEIFELLYSDEEVKKIEEERKKIQDENIMKIQRNKIQLEELEVRRQEKKKKREDEKRKKEEDKIKKDEEKEIKRINKENKEKNIKEAKEKENKEENLNINKIKSLFFVSHKKPKNEECEDKNDDDNNDINEHNEENSYIENLNEDDDLDIENHNNLHKEENGYLSEEKNKNSDSYNNKMIVDNDL